MSHKTKIIGTEKIAAIEKYLRGENSLNHLATLLGVNYSSIKQWLQTYHSLGPNGLLNTNKNSAYTEDLKSSAVKEYLASGTSHMKICKKYGIKSTCLLRNWILKYNGHDKLKSSGTGCTPIMTKSRKTTYEERVEIVIYCIEHQNNYTETAQKYQVSYRQVYNWTTKYESNGVDALQDNRGKRKAMDEMNEIEKLRAQNKLLEAKNKRQQMEIDFLKKLEEIERRWS
jgi:transposase